MLNVVNIFAGPGAGKSTLAAYFYYKMKMAGVKVELVTEYAKDLTWRKDWETLGNQNLVFNEQYM